MQHIPDQPEWSVTTIRLQGPADLIAMVPYLIGYHPHDGLLLVTVNHDIVTAISRYGLPEQAPAPDELISQAVQLLIRHASARVALIGYGPGERITPYMNAFSRKLTEQGIDIIDMIRCENGRYWSYLCSNPACCSPTGTSCDTGSNPAAAHAVLAGLVALPDQQVLRQTLASGQGRDREIMNAATAEARARARAEAKLNTRGFDDRYWFAEGVEHVHKCHEHVQAGRPIPAAELAWLGVLLTGVLVRDRAYTLYQQYGAEVARRLWTEVTRRIDPAYAAAPTSILRHLCNRSYSRPAQLPLGDYRPAGWLGNHSLRAALGRAQSAPPA
ncbi:DUF4192 domain-containing protein [Nonomuraea gerenzanensis]|uniref:DUF4192 domain-containing protein n=1 Tax=Nonomuraea gerenzanensis TaxID=93944 RepID=A0A1M4E9W9_9ACTN|nr:DUF4192 domain-containing protein [Nonomuraea gerenzanensis]UBU17817.1 DUF4192 domain-containing protein [Nonomuraea gerenzanensis]SBO95600.1 hypothetical protein BN4615_P5116 [Nonomuraea gerenzanensis]